MENMDKALQAQNGNRMVVEDNSPMGMLLDTARFEHLQRVAKLFADSKLIPETFRGKPSDCFIILQLAAQLKMNPWTLFNTVYVVHGKPGLEAKVLIAMANSSGVFKAPIQFTYTGEKMSRACTASAIHAATGDRIEQTVTMEIAKAEGWYDKPGSKWKTMPDMMLAYRSASWLIRLYAPEVMYGMKTTDELIDITPAEAKGVGAAREVLNGTSSFTVGFEEEAEATITEGPKPAPEKPKVEKPAPEKPKNEKAAAKAEAKPENKTPKTDKPAIESVDNGVKPKNEKTEAPKPEKPKLRFFNCLSCAQTMCENEVPPECTNCKGGEIEEHETFAEAKAAGPKKAEPADEPVTEKELEELFKEAGIDGKVALIDNMKRSIAPDLAFEEWGEEEKALLKNTLVSLIERKKNRGER